MFWLLTHSHTCWPDWKADSDTWPKPEDFGSFGSGHVILFSRGRGKLLPRESLLDPLWLPVLSSTFPGCGRRGLSEDVRTIGKQTLHRDHKCCVIWLQVLCLSPLDSMSSVLLLTWIHGTPVWANSCWRPWDCGKSLPVPHKAVSSQLLPISLSFCLTTVLRVPLQIAENTYPCLWQRHCFVWTGVFQKLSGVIFIIQRVSLKSLRYIRLFFS